MNLNGTVSKQLGGRLQASVQADFAEQSHEHVSNAAADERERTFFERFAFPKSKPNVEPCQFTDFLTEANRRVLAEIRDASLVIEVGSLLGASTRFLLADNPDRRIICVDPWERTYPSCLPQFSSGEQIYQAFLSNLWDVRDRIAVMRMPSWRALPMIAEAGIAVDAIYVDGDHAYEAVWNDLVQSSQLFPGIRIVGDDFGPHFRGVVGACLDFASEANRRLLVDGDAWEMGPVQGNDASQHFSGKVEQEIPLVSIITTCKGRLEHLRQTLPKMLAQQYSSRFEVVVVDYDCPDESFRWCVELEDRRLIGAHVLTDAENFNLSRARNLGARIARGKLLAFVDADVELKPTWLAEATRTLRNESAIIARASRFEGQSWDRCGTCVIDARTFHELQGYDEAISDWSLADLDLYERCRKRGSEAFFDPFLLTPIRHSDELRVQFHQEKNRDVADARNREYLENRVGTINPDGYAIGRMEVSRARQAEFVNRPASTASSSVSTSWLKAISQSLRQAECDSTSLQDCENIDIRLSAKDVLARSAQCDRCEQRVSNRCRALGRRLNERVREFGTDCPLGKWPTPALEELVTIGVTTFMRPDSLARLRASIKRLYPKLPLTIVDTQSNLSWGRNRVAQELETPYLLLCEDDFEFHENTNIETLVDVLNHDAEIGGVGGVLIEPVRQAFQPVQERLVSSSSVREAGITSTRLNVWTYDFECFRESCQMVPPRLRPRVTRSGTAYQPCEVILNFGLFRRELFEQFKWDEDLPLCEHRDWYWRVALARKRRMTVCRDVSILHHRDQPEGYAEFRNRRFNTHLKKKNGFQFTSPPSATNEIAAKPNLVLCGVGHSGTSIVAKQLFALGWNQCDADEQFAESVSIRKLNRQILLTGKLDVAQAEKVLRNLPSPWAVKDPRFVEFLPHWLPVLSRLTQPPLLLWLRRDVDALRQSYISRDELLPDDRPGIRGRPVEELCELAKRNFERYPWQKLSLTLEDIADATELFDATRVRTHAGEESFPESLSKSTRSMHI